MKIQILSDLHLEFFKTLRKAKEFLETLVCDCDMVCLAGDITTCNQAQDHLLLLSKVFKGKDIVYIPGNHEYYNSSKLMTDITLRDNSKKCGIHFLENDYYVKDDCVIVGACSWHENYVKRSSGHLNDFRLIEDLRKSPLSAVSWGNSSYLYFDSVMGMGQLRDKKVICMTHNAPLYQHTPLEYKGNELNIYFTNDWSGLIKKHDIKLWISGHLHGSVNFKKYGTQFIENSYGYVNHSENETFIKHLVVDV